MVNRNVRNRTVGSFNLVDLQNVFIDPIFNIYVITRFDIK